MYCVYCKTTYDDDDDSKRDENHLFKFKVGDRVRKAWRWSKHLYSRYDTPVLKTYCPIGTIVTIKRISPNGTLCVEWSRKQGNPFNWHLGASEMESLTETEDPRRYTATECGPPHSFFSNDGW